MLSRGLIFREIWLYEHKHFLVFVNSSSNYYYYYYSRRTAILIFIFHNDTLFWIAFSENDFSQWIVGEIKYRKKRCKAHVIRLLKQCIWCQVVVVMAVMVEMMYIVRIEIIACSKKCVFGTNHILYLHLLNHFLCEIFEMILTNFWFLTLHARSWNYR